MELLEDGVSLWKGAIFGFQPSVFGGVSPDFWWLDGLDWKQLFLSWSYQIRSLGQLAACLFKIVVVQPMINRLDTVPPPNGQYVNSTFITELDVYNPPTVIWGKGSSFWTTFKVIQIPPLTSSRPLAVAGRLGVFLSFLLGGFYCRFPGMKAPIKNCYWV